MRNKHSLLVSCMKARKAIHMATANRWFLSRNHLRQRSERRERRWASTTLTFWVCMAPVIIVEDDKAPELYLGLASVSQTIITELPPTQRPSQDCKAGVTLLSKDLNNDSCC